MLPPVRSSSAKVLVTLCLALGLAGCRCVDSGTLQFYACEQDKCPDGFLCCEGRCYQGSECPPPDPCEGGFICKGTCVDLRVSDLHCGGCNIACSGSTTCANGRCVPKTCADFTCAPNQVCIDDTCIDRVCVGMVCRDTEVCNEGACRTRLCMGSLCGAGSACVDGGCADIACLGVTCADGGACLKGRCDLELGCASGRRDNLETDVDCGGGVCASCTEARGCGAAADCAGLSCEIDGGADGGVDAGVRDGGADGGTDGGLPRVPGVCSRATLDVLDLTFFATVWRAPTEGDRTTYAAQTMQGRTGVKAVAAALIGTSEFTALRASHPPRQLLRQYYLVLLGRDLDATGEALYLPLFFANRHADVFTALVNSREFSTRYPDIP